MSCTRINPLPRSQSEELCHAENSEATTVPSPSSESTPSVQEDFALALGARYVNHLTSSDSESWPGGTYYRLLTNPDRPQDAVQQRILQRVEESASVQPTASTELEAETSEESTKAEQVAEDLEGLEDANRTFIALGITD